MAVENGGKPLENLVALVQEHLDGRTTTASDTEGSSEDSSNMVNDEASTTDTKDEL